MAKQNKSQITSEKALPLTKKNYILIAISVAICIIGYMLMSGGGTDDPAEFNPEELYSFRRITLAVIVVVFGHAMMVYAIMFRDKDEDKEENNK